MECSGPPTILSAASPLALQQQVGRADGVGLGVYLLAEQVRGDIFAALGRKLAQRLLSDGEHAAVPQAPS